MHIQSVAAHSLVCSLGTQIMPCEEECIEPLLLLDAPTALWILCDPFCTLDARSTVVSL